MSIKFRQFSAFVLCGIAFMAVVAISELASADVSSVTVDPQSLKGLNAEQCLTMIALAAIGCMALMAVGIMRLSVEVTKLNVLLRTRRCLLYEEEYLAADRREDHLSRD